MFLSQGFLPQSVSISPKALPLVLTCTEGELSPVALGSRVRGVDESGLQSPVLPATRCIIPRTHKARSSTGVNWCHSFEVSDLHHLTTRTTDSSLPCALCHCSHLPLHWGPDPKPIQVNAIHSIGSGSGPERAPEPCLLGRVTLHIHFAQVSKLTQGASQHRTRPVGSNQCVRGLFGSQQQ